ncbi:MAG: UDP-N-acetylmuramate--L-alanine ligase [Patescibacteria group bacterium]|nr:UDP-N-acetylmuramate--L-alanine ligase [Patescibacteria group bacterium]
MTLPKKAYFVGIGGIGMSALAQYLAAHAVAVSGSDREESPVTKLLGERGIEVTIGQVAENVPADADVVIYSDAVSQDNPERLRARELGMRQASYFELLGEVTEGKRTVAVAGTHGKTTTTGMLAKILHDAGASPSAIVGSIVRDFGGNYLSGSSDLFVVEACEYREHFLSLAPRVLVVTNIEWDHTDYFKDLAAFQAAFRALMERVPTDGVIVTDTTHPNIAPLLAGLAARIIDYKGEPTHEVSLPGEFNRLNARAAAAAARILVPGIDDERIDDSLYAFRGTWRRFEYKGKTSMGAEVYDDYAHHPTAVAVTLAELRRKTKGKVFVAFHPHLFSRTRDLLDGFAHAFRDADEVVIAPIYAAREKDDGSVSNRILAERIAAAGVPAAAIDSFSEITAYLDGRAGPGDVVMSMGAGDIYKVADALVAK